MVLRQERALRSGMTLVEVVLALLIISLALLAVAPLFSLGVKTNASSGQLSTANTLAQEKLEELICYPTTDPRMQIPSGSTITTFSNDLPSWWNPSTGETSTANASPGVGWFPAGLVRTYTVQAYRAQPAPTPPTLVTSTVDNEKTYYNPAAGAAPAPFYDFKLVRVTVQPDPGASVAGPFPGLRRTTQSTYVRYRNAQAN